MVEYLREGTVIIAITLLFIIAIFLSTNNNITGSATSQLVSTKVNVSRATPHNCNVTLKKGLNIISVPCFSDYTPISNLNETMTTNISDIAFIFSYVGGSDAWQAYNPHLPEYVVNDLQYLTRKKGYIIQMNNDSQINYPGYIAETPTVPLSNGWTLAGYPLTETKTLPDGLQSINDTYLLIETYYNNESGKNGYYTYYKSGNSNLTVLENYHGYWIKTNSEDTWTFN